MMKKKKRNIDVIVDRLYDKMIQDDKQPENK